MFDTINKISFISINASIRKANNDELLISENACLHVCYDS